MFLNVGFAPDANRIKHELLGVSEQTLERYGAVSPQTAQQMAEGIRRLSGAEIGISVTGIAGPGAAEPKKSRWGLYISASVLKNIPRWSGIYPAPKGREAGSTSALSPPNRRSGLRLRRFGKIKKGLLEKSGKN